MIRKNRNRNKNKNKTKHHDTQKKQKQKQKKQNKTKQNKAKQSKAKQSKAKQNKAKQSKAKQSKTKQNKAKQNKTKQNETKRNETNTHTHTHTHIPTPRTPHPPHTHPQQQQQHQQTNKQITDHWWLSDWDLPLPDTSINTFWKDLTLLEQHYFIATLKLKYFSTYIANLYHIQGTVSLIHKTKFSISTCLSLRTLLTSKSPNNGKLLNLLNLVVSSWNLSFSFSNDKTLIIFAITFMKLLGERGRLAAPHQNQVLTRLSLVRSLRILTVH